MYTVCNTSHPYNAAHLAQEPSNVEKSRQESRALEQTRYDDFSNQVNRSKFNSNLKS